MPSGNPVAGVPQEQERFGVKRRILAALVLRAPTPEQGKRSTEKQFPFTVSDRPATVRAGKGVGKLHKSAVLLWTLPDMSL